MTLPLAAVKELPFIEYSPLFPLIEIVVGTFIPFMVTELDITIVFSGESFTLENVKLFGIVF